ncbi:MAG TPA: ribonuclease HI family protein [Candidatus Paceibacterota bacterium]
MQKIFVFTDGGARGNPGPSGIGVVIQDGEGETIKEISKFLGRQTNNFAEYEAVIQGLEALKKHFGQTKAKELSIEIKMDSELVARQLSGKYQIKEPTLFPQFIKVHNLRVSAFPHIIFTHIPREKNKAADKLANEAMDRGH